MLEAFSSSARPILAEPEESILVKSFDQSGAGGWKWQVDGDDLSIVLADLRSQRSTEVEFNIGLVREMLACSGDRQGATESSLRSAPLLERFRSAMLLSKSNWQPSNKVVCQGQEPVQLVVKAAPDE